MQELNKSIIAFRSKVDEAFEKIDIEKLSNQLDELVKESEKQGFWTNSEHAQNIMKKIASLQAKVDPWKKLLGDTDDLYELSKDKDDGLRDDIKKQFEQLQSSFDNLKKDLRFSGLYDDHNVILNIFAGAGGTDAQDWASILLRMYSRWALNHKFKIAHIDESIGDEAGIKSVTIEIDGEYIYGKLKGEHGVHRLVRLSPFNAANLRQTSFAKVEILPKIEKSDKVEIDDKDLKIDVFRAGGHGGQSVNTTDSAVRVTHIPTGISVNIQNERSQIQNKEIALTILKSKLAQLQKDQHTSKLSDIKGPNQSAQWGNQIRSYVLHPYNMVKDTRTKFETTDTQSVLDGKIDGFINAYLEN